MIAALENLTASNSDHMGQVFSARTQCGPKRHCTSEAKPACSLVRGAASLALVLVVLGSPAVALAQAAPTAQEPARPPAPPDALPPFDDDFGDNGDQVVRVGSDYTLAAGDEVRELVVVMGNVTLDGHVNGDVVVILGEARLGPMAVVDGDIVVVGGSMDVREGAQARNDLVVIGGGLDAPSGFMPGGEQVVFGFRALGDRLRGFLPWLLRGVMWARPIVPDLGWVWALVVVVFLIYLGVLLIFEHPVRVTADRLAETPLKALLTGLMVLLLVGPVALLLAASVIGLLVVPVALCAIFVAGLIGKIAVARWLGTRLVSEGEESGRILLARSFAIGSVLLIVVYMIPILGGVVWALAGATGLGAAMLAFAAAYRKENPPPPPPPAPVVPPMPPAPPASPASFGTEAPSAAFSPAEPLPAVPPAMAEQSVTLFPRAGFTDRLAAFVLDAILVGIAIALLDPLDAENFIPVFLAYRFAFWMWKSTTVGGIICQLRVTRIDGSRVGPAESLVRSLASIFSIGVLGLGCLWILRDPDQQAWHDKIAGTFVVKVPRNWPL
jgi:uncharacterized RDD family membrane protein YckC